MILRLKGIHMFVLHFLVVWIPGVCVVQLHLRNLLNLEEKDDELQKEFGQSLMENVAKMKKENSSSGSKKMGSVYTWCLFKNIFLKSKETDVF